MSLHPDAAFLTSVPTEPILGFEEDGSGGRKYVTYKGEKSLLTVAPNRTGKGASVIAINAICHRASLVLIDPKGESCNEEGLALWRAHALGQKTFVFDPLRVVWNHRIPPVPGFAGHVRAGFDPVDMIRKSAYPEADARLVASSLITIEGVSPFFSRAAQNLLAGHLCYVARDVDYCDARTMKSVWRDLTHILLTDLNDLMREVATHSKLDICKATAVEFLSNSEDVQKDVLSTLRAQAGQILSSPQILDSLSYSSLDFGKLQGREPISVFIILPGWASDIYAPYIRLILSCMFAQIERSGLPPPGSKRPKTLLLLDEYATYAAEFIREVIPRLPGYGVQFWPFIQDFNQLRARHKDGWETFISNAGVLQNFGGSSDLLTTEHLSKLTGTITEIAVSVTDQAVGAGGSTSFSGVGRPTIFPYEIATMNRTDALKELLLFAGIGWMFAKRFEFFRDFPRFMAWLSKVDEAQRVAV